MVANLAQIRSSYPEYNDMSDTQLLDAAHSKFYSDMPKTEFYDRMGATMPGAGRGLLGGTRATGFLGGKVDPTGGLAGQIRSMGLGPYRKAVQAVPLGARQESQRILGKVPDAAWQRYLAKRNLTPAEQQIIGQHPMEARAGRGLTDVAGYTAATALAPESLPWQMGAGGVAGGMIAPKGHALAGTISGGLFPALPKILGLAPKAASFLRGLTPGKYAKSMVENLPATRNAENVLNNLGQGRTPEENSKNLATKIKGAKEVVSKYFTSKYNNLTKRVGPESIYGKKELPDSYKSLYTKKKTVISSVEKFQGKALPVFKEVTEDIPKDSPVKTYSSDIKKAHQDFVKNPNFARAHKLQSVLGDETRRVFKNPLSNLQDKAIAQGWKQARGKLLNDINSHLNNVDSTGGLSAEYKDIGEKYKSNAVPYKNKYIEKVATGKVTNPRNLSTIFKNPESDVKKVVSDLGPQARDQIIYNELYHRNPIAKNILNNYGKLEEKGMQSYVSPKLDQQMGDLKTTHAQDEFKKYIGNKLTAKNILKSAQQLEKQGLLRSLNPSLRDQIDVLKAKYGRAKWAKRGAGVLGAAYLAKKLLPSHLTQQLIP